MSTTPTPYQIGALLAFAINAVGPGAGCCPECCAPCRVLRHLADSGDLDRYVAAYVHDSGLGWQWWTDAGRVDREWLHESWPGTCACRFDPDGPAR